VKPTLILPFALLLSMGIINAQVTLDADNVSNNTYELINSKFAPGYTAVENPECVHPSFGRHIVEVFDAALNKNVFEFYSHVAEDNDRCINLDRQRIEIKTYDQSPDNLKGIIGETITYKWQFKLPTGFQPSTSFTHIHQIKAVGGDDDPPIFTLTPRKKSVNKMQLIHDNTTTVSEVDLSLFLNVWVEATEIIKVGANGTYSILIKRVSDNATLLSYSSNDIMTIRPDNTFIRPKWGIYRSLNVPTDLRDETIRFAGFSIAESAILPIELTQFDAKAKQKSVLLTWTTASEKDNALFNIEQSINGKDFQTIGQVKGNGTTNAVHHYTFIDNTIPLLGVRGHYYRLKQVDFNGRFTYSPMRSVAFGKKGLSLRSSLVQDVLDITVSDDFGDPSVQIGIFNTTGQRVLDNKVQGAQRINISALPSGLYIIRTETGEIGRFVKH
jgi:Secretion system C-terminal sorting domain